MGGLVHFSCIGWCDECRQRGTWSEEMLPLAGKKLSRSSICSSDRGPRGVFRPSGFTSLYCERDYNLHNISVASQVEKAIDRADRLLR